MSLKSLGVTILSLTIKSLRRYRLAYAILFLSTSTIVQNLPPGGTFIVTFPSGVGTVISVPSTASSGANRNFLPLNYPP